MGENEQGGMLRVVVVVGLIAIIAMSVIFAVTGLKGNMNKNTNAAVGAVVKTSKPVTLKNPNVQYASYTPTGAAWGDNQFLFPVVGDIPTNSWRDVSMVVSSDKSLAINIDVNAQYEAPAYVGNDLDDVSKRYLDIVRQSDGQLMKHAQGEELRDSGGGKFNMEPNTKYVIRLKYFNNTGKTFVETKDAVPNQYKGWQFPVIFTAQSSGQSYKFNVDSFEAATYDDKYNS